MTKEKETKKPAKAEVKETPKETGVSATLELSGTEYKGKGATVFEALKTIQFPMRVVEKGILKVGKKELHLPAKYIRGLRGAKDAAIAMLEKRLNTVK